MFLVYVLKSAVASKSYVGLTDDLQRRIHEHNSGKHFYTRRHKPWVVIYKEQFDTFADAKDREKYFKSTSGRRFLKKVFDCTNIK
ncbi:hypothetical protein A2W60_01145 [Candidatus Azambacteria bacterium RIFCSPHIGHO2_02_46_12]|uniref:GIY-YIG domain-containing protein n=1 Tax=Candidatus Azambacteria bacterium RIFCSPHIGHO2_02_46_12 TaxID=1797295 RepID=A0A1F5BKB2_9BACT|nr:MAG: hypothetical protein A2W60_01145 [Candidatus Azambacteria bacterium RIFCSPHIGHO2_02_46_12]